MEKDREVKLAACAVLLDMWMNDAGPCYVPEYGDQYEQILVDALAKAKRELDGYRRSRAARLALDALLPGWQYVDASDHLPQEKWRKFVSDSPDEWREWLTQNGVPADVVESLVARVFEEK